MKLIPILFSTEMVQAILENRKTETRRILKIKGCKPFIPDSGMSVEDIKRWNENYHPYGQAGDILWVRENYYKPPFITGKMLRDGADTWPKYFYPADSTISHEQLKEWGWKLKPSIHMPYAACRLFLRIKKISIARLHDITEPGIKREGFVFGADRHMHPVLWFQSLWSKINGHENWKANPWVWVIEFEKTEKPNL